MNIYKGLISLCAVTLAGVAALSPASAKKTPSENAASAPAQVMTASEAFVRMPAETLDLLTTSMRRDLLDYYANDSIHPVMNAMEGLSELVPPVTDDYLKVQVTPVTTLTIKMLPKGNGQVVMSIYTIGDSLQAADSDVRFYDTSMQLLNSDKFLKQATAKDFLNLGNLDSKKKKEMEEIIPFPTVEYRVSPRNDDLVAILTVGEYLGREAIDTLAPYLNRERTYTWKGNRYKME